MNTTPRLAWFKIAPKAFQAMLGVSGAIEATRSATRAVDLVQTRVSQINGCAYCLDMHVRDLRAQGEAGSASTASPPGAR
jgi:AhpD family alkylhydroperoxidase